MLTSSVILTQGLNCFMKQQRRGGRD